MTSRNPTISPRLTGVPAGARHRQRFSLSHMIRDARRSSRLSRAFNSKTVDKEVIVADAGKYLPEPLLQDLIFNVGVAARADVDSPDRSQELAALAALLRPAVDSALTAISGGQEALAALPYGACHAAGVLFDDLLDRLGDTISSVAPTLYSLSAEQQHEMLRLLSDVLLHELPPHRLAPWMQVATTRQRRGRGYVGGTSDIEHARAVRRVGTALPSLKAVLIAVLCAAWEGHKTASAAHPLVVEGYVAFLRSYRGGIDAAI